MNKNEFVSYEYKEVFVKSEHLSLYRDCYENFGWFCDGNLPSDSKQKQVVLRLKRDRKIVNKAELTRLQRHFEACVNDLEKLEKAKTSSASIWAISVAILGTAFMAGSVFAVSHEPPVIWLCVLLAIPGFAGWILPYFLYRYVEGKQKEKLQPMIEDKQEEIFQICEKGHSLL